MGDMPRQVVVCCDGTNNTLTGGTNDTNVVHLHDHLARGRPAGGFERVLYYDPGVGSPGMLPPIGLWEWFTRARERLEGLASGSGVFDNIAAAYIFLMRHWRDHEDRIYLFGFSRGAFTVRAVAGMVNLFGVVRPEYESLVPTLVYLYFSPTPDSSRTSAMQSVVRNVHRNVVVKGAVHAGLPGAQEAPPSRAGLAWQVRETFSGPTRAQAWVHFIGVWDTVESVGLPGPLSRVNPAPPNVVGKRYLHIRHALSLDEHRWPFLPRLYEEPGDVDEPVCHPSVSIGNTTQTLRQRWYPGVHCDAGGGYAPEGSSISDAALRWMAQEAPAELGLAALPPLRPAGCEPAAKRHDPLYETPYWALAGMTVREMRSYRDKDGRPEPFHAIEAPNRPAEPVESVWAGLRSPWPVLRALVAGFICLFLSGVCLLPERPGTWTPEAVLDAFQATSLFAGRQLDTLGLRGLWLPEHRPWRSAAQPGWAMAWDLLFIACWGYLLARISSRAFTWIAGWRGVDSPRPPWLGLGFMPMLLVGGDVAEDLLLLLSLGLDAAGSEMLALGALWLGSVGSLAKVLGFFGCIPLVAVRLGIVISPRAPWIPRPPAAAAAQARRSALPGSQ